MKKQHFLIAVTLVIFIGSRSYSQENYQQQINEQVWKPFIESFSTNNDKAFEAVHSKEIIRVLQDDGRIWGHEQYFPVKDPQEAAKKPAGKRNIELRFIQRIASADKAFEVGYYKSSWKGDDGKSRDFYGKFHVVLRKENGHWKILVDADSSKGASKEEFDKAAAM